MKAGLLRGALCSALAVCVAVQLHAQRGPRDGGPGHDGGGPHQGMTSGAGFPAGQGSRGGSPPGGRGGVPSGGRAADVPRPSTHTPLGPPGRWWDDRNFALSIGLSKNQQRKMDATFNKNKPALLERYNNLQMEQSKLEALMNLSQPDKARLFAQIDAVNQARAALEKVNTQMLLQIRQEMQPDQIARLDKLRDKPPDESEN
ncbi:MAG TPA: periplasmic heavy metal sensor [Acidobacteriaceae bacterium]